MIRKILGDILEEYREEKYKKGFNLLMEYWDCIPEDEREKLDIELKRVGL